MITIKELEWDNWFSYGEGNKLDLTESKVTQITGVNGSGKSSIPVILGEVLTGKNAFGKTKQKLFNRYIDNPTIRATIYLDKDGVEYIIKYVRGKTLKLTLFEAGIDISSHTSSGTLNTLNSLLGFEFKLLWQLIYQSSTNGIDFLVCTDTLRKNFLINLFSLDKYLEIHEQFKKLSRELSSELLVIKGKLTTVNSFVEKNQKNNLTLRELEIVPMVSKEDIDNLTDLKVQLANIANTNKKINDNNLYKSLLENLDTSILSENIPTEYTKSKTLKDEEISLTSKIKGIMRIKDIHANKVYKINELPDTCPTCYQRITETIKNSIVSDDEVEIDKLTIEESSIGKRLIDLQHRIPEAINIEGRILKKDQVSKELQDLLLKIDKELPSEVLDEKDLKSRIWELEQTIKNLNVGIKIMVSRNLEIEAHNSKVKVIKEQLVEYKEQLAILEKEIEEKTFTIGKIDLIKKAYSTNGLLAYKLEYLVKDLQEQINEYLEELSDGRFQLIFTIKGEKLNIDIIDDGKTISIEELSAGELSRVNVSTLLAIRKLMSAISSTKINILFLDEITGVLDSEGKEKLIDILLDEKDLNTFLVSHEYENALIPKIEIIKENRISRINYE